MLDSVRLRAELFFIHRALSRVVATRCENMLDDLRAQVPGTTAVVIWQSLFADCLRVVHCAALADGVIYDFEIEEIRDLLTVAARHYTGTPQSTYGCRAPVDVASTRAFLDCYAQDRGPFGRGADIPWLGHTLCSRAAEAGEHEPLDRYSQLMWWLIEAACQFSKVSLDDPRARVALQDIHDLRRALTSAGFGPQPEVDRRIQVFLSSTRVFTPVQQALSVSEADPFDVELLHGEARASFQQLIDQATADAPQSNTGRTLLVVGRSGDGKTHLLRSFWSHVQEYGRGFAAYAQMYSNVDDYTRYLLQHIVDSLARPYAGHYGEQTGLYELARSLARMNGTDFVDKVERLAELHGGARSVLDGAINRLVDELLSHSELSQFDPDLLRVLLYALCLDQKTTPRVYKYLRCESMNDHDRSLIGNVAPRTAREDPKSMIRSLARLAFVTRRATLVLMVDQAELSGLDSDQAMMTFQRAVDALLGIVSEVPSTIAVIACLSNLYDKAAKVLGRPTLDRIEKDPPAVRLSSNRSYDEIKAIVSRRLAWMFAEAGAVYRASEPVYPIPEAQLRNLANRRPRDILDWCQQFRERCALAGKIVEDTPSAVLPSIPPPPAAPGHHEPATPRTAEPPPTVLPRRPAQPIEGSAPAQPLDQERRPPPPPFEQIAAAWNEACYAPGINEPDRADEILSLVAVAAKAYAAETGAGLVIAPIKGEQVRLKLSAGAQEAELVIAVTDRSPARGAFGTQIDGLRRSARGAIPVAVRTVEFPSGAVSFKTVTQLTDAGGRAIHLDSPTVRALVAYQRFQPAFAAEHVDAWRRRDRPISNMAPIARMFELAPSRPTAETANAANGTTAYARDESTPPPDTTTAKSNGIAAAARPRTRAAPRAVSR